MLYLLQYVGSQSYSKGVYILREIREIRVSCTACFSHSQKLSIDTLTVHFW